MIDLLNNEFFKLLITIFLFICLWFILRHQAKQDKVIKRMADALSSVAEITALHNKDLNTLDNEIDNINKKIDLRNSNYRVD